jgi:hypothetical protein
MKNQRGGRGGRGGASRAPEGNWRDASSREQGRPKQEAQSRAPQANRAAPAQPKPVQPFNVREVTDFLSSRYTAAYEDYKRTSNSNEKKKSQAETPAVVLYQPENENAWGPGKTAPAGIEDFVSALETALKGHEQEAK